VAQKVGMCYVDEVCPVFPRVRFGDCGWVGW
jgi:hypothetical protein